MTLALFALMLAYAQSSAASHSTAPPEPQYFDEPQFTVA